MKKEEEENMPVKEKKEGNTQQREKIKVEKERDKWKKKEEENGPVKEKKKKKRGIDKKGRK